MKPVLSSMAGRGSWRRNQFAVTVASFMGFTGFTLVMPFLPLYIHQLGVDDVGEIALWAGLSLGVTPAVTAVLSPFWGRLADRYGRKLMVERSLISFVIVMSAMAYVTRAWHIFALRAVQGVFAGYGGLTLAMAAESAPRDRMATAIGLVQTAQRLGPALGPVIGGAVAELMGIRRAFFVTAVFYAAALVVVFLLYEDPIRGPARRDEARPRGDVRALLKAPEFLLMMASIFVLTFVDRSFAPILPLYLAREGRGVEQVVLLSGVLFSLAAAGAVAGNQTCEWLLRRAAASKVIAGGSGAATAGLLWFLSTSNDAVMGAALLLFGAGAGAAITAAYTAGGRVVPATMHATGFGFLTGSSLAGLAISPVLAGLLSRSRLLAVFAVDLVLLAVIAAVTFRRERL
ncbi:MAG: tetA [Acidobacteria bacterium]|nr:tetA [Acidobacteriota bacterium]